MLNSASRGPPCTNGHGSLPRIAALVSMNTNMAVLVASHSSGVASTAVKQTLKKLPVQPGESG